MGNLKFVRSQTRVILVVGFYFFKNSGLKMIPQLTCLCDKKNLKQELPSFNIRPNKNTYMTIAF